MLHTLSFSLRLLQSRCDVAVRLWLMALLVVLGAQRVAHPAEPTLPTATGASASYLVPTHAHPTGAVPCLHLAQVLEQEALVPGTPPVPPGLLPLWLPAAAEPGWCFFFPTAAAATPLRYTRCCGAWVRQLLTTITPNAP